MISDEYRLLGKSATMKGATELLEGMCGTVPMVNDDCRITDMLTSGDLMRLMECDTDFLDQAIGEIMNRSPKTVRPSRLRSVAIHWMEEDRIMAFPVEDEASRLAGIVHLHDLMHVGAE